MPLVTDREKCAHLLRRFGFGASEAELTYYLQDGYAGAVDRLLAYNSVPEGPLVDIEQMRNPQNKRINMPGAVGWWTTRLIMTRRPLQEKMTLFWHDHFATSGSKVAQPLLMVAQNEIFRNHATGNFKTLLSETSKDPAMLFWLDNQENVAGKPNENFAREVMELFTIGIGNYSEADVQQAARAFTGWSFRRLSANEMAETTRQATFINRAARHDRGEKTLLGKTGTFNGDDVLNMLAEHPRTSEYIAEKVWTWFAYPNPEPAVVARMARIFRESNLEIKALLRAIMTSTEFYSEKAERSVVKSPADFCVSTLRQLGVGQQMERAVEAAGEGLPRLALAPALAAINTMKSMGMWLFHPPDVDGWEGGQAWISSATMVERIGWGERLFGMGNGQRFAMRFPANSLFVTDRTPEAVVARLLSVFDAQLPQQKVQALVSAAQTASGGALTAANANAVAATVTKLIFASPEFQFS